MKLENLLIVFNDERVKGIILLIIGCIIGISIMFLISKRRTIKNRLCSCNFLSKILKKSVNDTVNNKEKERYNFQTLTPTKDADVKLYEDAINFAFSKNDIKNVAISGAYSAGKSSVLESYKDKHPEYNYIHISLAHFSENKKEEKNAIDSDNRTGSESSASNRKNSDKKNDSKEGKTGNSRTVLEGKILNQLLHQVNVENIPLSNFKVKRPSKGKSIWCISGWLFLTVLCILLLSVADSFSKYIKCLEDEKNPLEKFIAFVFDADTLIVIGFLLVCCIAVGIFNIVKYQSNKNLLRRINIQGNEIEIFENEEESCFDKYLNEVLYLFENSGADVIVFEDIDRFESVQIFERLREINYLVNKKREQNAKKTKDVIRFFYLIRDDIFLSKDRSKFFDYIIPVVPYVGKSNSYGHFVELFQNGKIESRFTDIFLKQLSLFVDDMRLLKNIYNEFIIYINRLNTTDLDWNKMLAVMVYKNIFPKDFSELQLGRGFVSTVLEKRKELVDRQLETEKKIKEELEIQVKYARNEILNSEEELNAVYDYQVKKLPKDYYSRLTEEGKKQEEKLKRELVIRKQAISDKINGNISNLEKKIEEHEYEIVRISSKKFFELLSKAIENNKSLQILLNDTEKNKFSEVMNNEYYELLKYLLCNGFIDEDYADYVTYFDEKAICKEDKIFLRTVTDQRGKQYDYSLKNPKLVMEYLKELDFERIETLNFDLLAFLVSKPAENMCYIQKIVEQIEKRNEFEFISKYYKQGNKIKEFVIQMNKYWPEMFSVALATNSMPENIIRAYSVDTLLYSDDNEINAVNKDEVLTRYISSCEDYLNIESPDIERLGEVFEKIGVKFASFEKDVLCSELFMEVYNRNCYQISFDNIYIMLKYVYEVQDTQNIDHKNFTEISSRENQPLFKCVKENINEYIGEIVNRCGDIYDEEAAVVKLLNLDNLTTESVQLYCMKLQTVISSVSLVKGTKYWPILFQNGNVQGTIENVALYFEEYGVDKTLSTFISQMDALLDFGDMWEKYNEEFVLKFFDAVAISKDFSIEQYEKIIDGLNCEYTNFSIKRIDQEFFEVLIHLGYIPMCKDSLLFVRKEYADLVFSFIRAKFKEYIQLQSSEVYQKDELLEILTWEVSDEDKLSMLQFEKAPLSIIEAEYTDLVNEYILENNLMISDKVKLYEEYDNYRIKTREKIVAFVLYEISTVSQRKYKLADSLLSIILKNEKVTSATKVSLFVNAVPDMDKLQCLKHLDELQLSELKYIFEGSSGRKNYEKNAEVTEILKAFKQKGWIYDFNIDNRNEERYMVLKHEPKIKK